MFVLFVVCGAGVTTRAAHLRSSSKSRMPECQSGDAGAILADRTNFQNPQLQSHNVCGGRQLAQFGLQIRTGSGQHRDAVPLFKSRGSQVGRQRPHKPSMSGFDSRPRHHVSSGRSIIQEVTRLASGNALRDSATNNWPRSANCMAAGAAKHGAKPWRSTISKSREG